MSQTEQIGNVLTIHSVHNNSFIAPDTKQGYCRYMTIATLSDTQILYFVSLHTFYDHIS